MKGRTALPYFHERLLHEIARDVAVAHGFHALTEEQREERSVERAQSLLHRAAAFAAGAHEGVLVERFHDPVGLRASADIAYRPPTPVTTWRETRVVSGMSGGSRSNR